MSKIGKINISIPEKVKVDLSANNVNIEGPLGKKSLNIDSKIFDLDIKDGKEISIKPKKVDQSTKRLWGMNRSLLNNAIIGVNKGYEKILEMNGVGYRAALKGDNLNLQLGFSHDINYAIPKEVKIIVEKQTTIKINGSDKQQVGTIASKMNNQISQETKKIRSRLLQKLSNKIRFNFYKSNINKIRKVLFESEFNHDYLVGFTDNYIRVFVKGNKSMINKIFNVKLLFIVEQNRMFGEIV